MSEGTHAGQVLPPVLFKVPAVFSTKPCRESSFVVKEMIEMIFCKVHRCLKIEMQIHEVQCALLAVSFTHTQCHTSFEEFAAYSIEHDHTEICRSRISTHFTRILQKIWQY